jgi:hypothetical protein
MVQSAKPGCSHAPLKAPPSHRAHPLRSSAGRTYEMSVANNTFTGVAHDPAFRELRL